MERQNDDISRPTTQPNLSVKNAAQAKPLLMIGPSTSTPCTQTAVTLGKASTSQMLRLTLAEALEESKAQTAEKVNVAEMGKEDVDEEDETTNQHHIEQMIDQMIEAYTDSTTLEESTSFESIPSDSSKVSITTALQVLAESSHRVTFEDVPTDTIGGAQEIGTQSMATSENISFTHNTASSSICSIGSLVCRICHNAENPERLVSPCLCKGSLTYVHVHCLERWIATSRTTRCELCQYNYNTEQTLRYTLIESLRMWYSRSLSRRALQEDCQMFSLLTLVAFAIMGTLVVGIQYYVTKESTMLGISHIWTKTWLFMCLSITLAVYGLNIYMILKQQLMPWYYWWQSARDIRLVLENRRPFTLRPNHRSAQRPLLSGMPMSVIQPSADNASNSNNNASHVTQENIMNRPLVITMPNVSMAGTYSVHRQMPIIIEPIFNDGNEPNKRPTNLLLPTMLNFSTEV